mgnify:CR=1 FL=1
MNRLKDKIKREFHQSVIEVGTGICRNIAEARTDAPLVVEMTSSRMSRGFAPATAPLKRMMLPIDVQGAAVMPPTLLRRWFELLDEVADGVVRSLLRNRAEATGWALLACSVTALVVFVRYQRRIMNLAWRLLGEFEEMVIGRALVLIAKDVVGVDAAAVRVVQRVHVARFHHVEREVLDERGERGPEIGRAHV